MTKETQFLKETIMKASLSTKLIGIILFVSVFATTTESAVGANRSQLALFVRVTLTLSEDGSSIYVMEGGTSNALVNTLPCEAHRTAKLGNATVEESARRNPDGVCIYTTTFRFPALSDLRAFLEKGGGYLQEQDDKIALGMGLRPDKPTPFVSGSLQYIIRMPAIDLYNPLNGMPSSYASGNQVVWRFRSEAELLDIEVRGSLCPCPKDDSLSKNGSRRLTIYFGGAGMDGAYIPSQVGAFKKRCFSNVEAATRTEGTSTDAWHSFSKYRDRVKDENWSLSDSGLETNVGQKDKLNLIGYSYGSLVAAQTALYYADKGIITEHVVLVGSPISKGMLSELRTNPKILKVSVIDLPDDSIHAEMSGVALTLALPGLGIDARTATQKGKGHFYYALGGEEGDKRRAELADQIKRLFGNCR